LSQLKGRLRAARVVRIFAVKAQTARLGDCDLVLEGTLLYGAGCELQASTRGSIWLSEY
jgi:hypothetical protein